MDENWLIINKMKWIRKAQFAKKARSKGEMSFLKTICPHYTDRPKPKHMQAVLKWLQSDPQAVPAVRTVLTKSNGISALHSSCLLHYALKQGAVASVASILESLECPAEYKFKASSYQNFIKNYLVYLWTCVKAIRQDGSLWTASEDTSHLEGFVPVVNALSKVLVSGLFSLNQSKTDLCQQICHFLVLDLADLVNTFVQVAEKVKRSLLDFTLEEIAAADRSFARAREWSTRFLPVIEKFKQAQVNTPPIMWIQDSAADQQWRKDLMHQLRNADTINRVIKEANAQAAKKRKEQEKLKREREERERRLLQERKNKAIHDCLADLKVSPGPYPSVRQPKEGRQSPEESTAAQTNFLPLQSAPFYTGQVPSPYMRLIPSFALPTPSVRLPPPQFSQNFPNKA